MYYNYSFKAYLRVDHFRGRSSWIPKRIYVNETEGSSGRCFVRYDNAIWYVTTYRFANVWELAKYCQDYKPGCIQKVKTE